jgi:hypothetical protein
MRSKRSPRHSGLGRKLLQLDSNQQPFDYQPLLDGSRPQSTFGRETARTVHFRFDHSRPDSTVTDAGFRLKSVGKVSVDLDPGRVSDGAEFRRYVIFALLGILFGGAYGIVGFYGAVFLDALGEGDAAVFMWTVVWVAAGTAVLATALARTLGLDCGRCAR